MTTTPVRIERVDVAEADAIVQRLLPLPHEIVIERKAVVQPGGVGVRWDGAGDVVRPLRELLRQSAGDQFEIVAGIIDGHGAVDGYKLEQASRLGELPNREQAYVIEPAADSRLIVGALSATGVRYAMLTLCQLIEANMDRDTVTIPLASIVDWPDFDDRGFWHMPLARVPQLAAMKFNHFHCATFFKMMPDGQPRAMTATGGQGTSATSPPLSDAMAMGREYGVDIVPGIIHLDFWEACCPGFAATYPQMIGKGERAKGGNFKSSGYRVPCASNPQLARTLAALMTQLAADGASQFYVWMSEFPGQCECDACLREGQFQAEVRSTIQAWREARKTYPALKLRLFFGAGGFAPGEKWIAEYPPAAIDAILASLPKEVRMCVSLGIKEKKLADFAADGGTVTRCFIVTPTLWDGFCCQHIVNRLRKLHGQGMHGVTQFTDGRFADVFDELDLQFSALAEYAWNTHGRTVEAFGAAWATRRGEKHPQAFGRWLSLMSRLVAQTRSMDDLIWSGTWLDDVAGALAGEDETTAPEFEPTAEGCRTALEFTKYFPAKRLSLRQEVAARAIAYASQLSIDDAIATARDALAAAEQLDWREPARHGALLLRYCDMEKAAGALIDACRGKADAGAIGAAHAAFGRAAGAFVDALETRVADLPRGDAMRDAAVGRLRQRVSEIGGR